MSLLVVGIAMLVYGLFIYTKSKNEVDWRAFDEEKQGMAWNIMKLSLFTSDRTKINKYSKYIALAGLATLALYYLECKGYKETKCKSFFF